jgi:antitoxin component of MazEF toxin-antitoxin module
MVELRIVGIAGSPGVRLPHKVLGRLQLGDGYKLNPDRGTGGGYRLSP